MPKSLPKKVRVLYLPNGEIRVIHPVRPKNKGETDEQYFDTNAKKVGLDDLPYEDMLKTDLPDRKDRAKWRGEKGKGIKIDHSIVTPAEKKKKMEDEINLERAKKPPDMLKLFDLQEGLRKHDYLT